MKRRYFSLALLCALVLAVTGGVMAQDTPRATAKSFVADTLGLSAGDLEVAYEHTTTVVGIGEVTQYKMALSEAAGGSEPTYGAVVDASGNAWSPEEFRALAADADRQQFGKLDPRLFARYEADPEAIIPVAIWLHTDDSLYAGLRGPDYVGRGVTGATEPLPGTDPDRISTGTAEEVTSPDSTPLLAARQAVADHVATVQAAVVARLAARGVEVTAVPETPCVTATLNFAQVLEVAEDPDVGRIFGDDAVYTDMGD